MLVLLGLVGIAQAQTPQTVFEFVSAPGDYIGQGQTVVLTPADVSFNVQLSGGVVSFSLTNFSQGTFWTLDLAAPGGQPLAAGSYANATRFPFEVAGVPGLSLYGDGRGCDQDFGSFQILQIAVDPSSNTLSQFAANFVQFCESTSKTPLTGAIRYNSAIPPPELISPTITIAQPLNPKGCYEATSPSGAQVTAAASASDSVTSNLKFKWSTSTGLSGTGTQFYFPVSLNQYLTLSLTATDPSTGNSATASRLVCSSDTTPPTVTIVSPRPGAAYHELPALDAAVFDLVDKDIKTVQIRVGENASYLLGRDQQLHTRLISRRAIGDMIETLITVSATDAWGNTGQSTVSFLIDKSLR